jgi:hypothetical protein
MRNVSARVVELVDTQVSEACDEQSWGFKSPPEHFDNSLAPLRLAGASGALRSRGSRRGTGNFVANTAGRATGRMAAVTAFTLRSVPPVRRPAGYAWPAWASWNCSASVDPTSAAVAASPPEMASST